MQKDLERQAEEDPDIKLNENFIQVKENLKQKDEENAAKSEEKNENNENNEQNENSVNQIQDEKMLKINLKKIIMSMKIY
mgnify:CR=1 FL=1